MFESLYHVDGEGLLAQIMGISIFERTLLSHEKYWHSG